MKPDLTLNENEYLLGCDFPVGVLMMLLTELFRDF